MTNPSPILKQVWLPGRGFITYAVADGANTQPVDCPMSEPVRALHDAIEHLTRAIEASLDAMPHRTAVRAMQDVEAAAYALMKASGEPAMKPHEEPLARLKRLARAVRDGAGQTP